MILDRSAFDITVGVDAAAPICVGDSGGPLVGEIDGAPRLLGVAKGSHTVGVVGGCSPAAAFTRLARDDAWVLEKVGPPAR
jgi:hypothetical protein